MAGRRLRVRQVSNNVCPTLSKFTTERFNGGTTIQSLPQNDKKRKGLSSKTHT